MAADNEEWTSIRVRKSTLERLHAYARHKLALVEDGKLGAEGQTRYGRLSADAAISVFLTESERNRKSRKK
jgi:hypothetical protein